ncbi:uncharacterized protein UV8b_06408 [Ustilaginoidea virens]|uniref:Uncharacterized protein n=1 Tax=Ustilaginoidea virens TaxID=1159556 RepID=A0A8E5HVD7_USTVR|nr:uncharacterized protein UV8b_06408 [Ustilaginoidea virens]QUC22167.1 hypothetical protein UV8b_06408 [Ustilaginoidea virens]
MRTRVRGMSHYCSFRPTPTPELESSPTPYGSLSFPGPGLLHRMGAWIDGPCAHVATASHVHALSKGKLNYGHVHFCPRTASDASRVLCAGICPTMGGKRRCIYPPTRFAV